MSTTERVVSAMPSHNTLNAPDSNNATWFNPEEGVEGNWSSPSDWILTNRYRYYQHLAEINRGRKRGLTYWNDPYHTYQANSDLIEAVGSQLNLLPRQQRRAKAWFGHFDLQFFGMRADLVACCLCMRVVHEDEQDVRRTHPSVPDDDEDKPIEFAEIPENFDLHEKNVMSMYHKLDSDLRQYDRPSANEFDRYKTDEQDSTRQLTPGDVN